MYTVEGHITMSFYAFNSWIPEPIVELVIPVYWFFCITKQAMTREHMSILIAT